MVFRQVLWFPPPFRIGSSKLSRGNMAKKWRKTYEQCLPWAERWGRSLLGIEEVLVFAAGVGRLGHRLGNRRLRDNRSLGRHLALLFVILIWGRGRGYQGSWNGFDARRWGNKEEVINALFIYFFKLFLSSSGNILTIGWIIIIIIIIIITIIVIPHCVYSFYETKLQSW